jgi:MFS family permease
MGLGIVLGGLLAARVGPRMSRDRASWFGFAGLSAGVVLLCAGPDLAVTLAGMLATGAAVAVALSSVQSLISERHGPRGLSESSGFGELFGMVAPFVVALSASVGLSWRGGMLIVPLAAASMYAAVRLRSGRPTAVAERARADEAGAGGRFDRRSWLAWTCGVLLASAEFTIVLWLPDLLRLNDRLRPAVGAALVSMLLAGMAAGRLIGGRLPLNGNLDPELAASVVVAGGGFLVLWWTTWTPLAVTAVLVVGAAMSVQFPVALARLFAAAPDDARLASARSASGQGLAMLTCPPLLGLLSEAVGLRWAALLFPGILVAALATVRLAPVDRGLRRPARTRTAA